LGKILTKETKVGYKVSLSKRF